MEIFWVIEINRKYFFMRTQQETQTCCKKKIVHVLCLVSLKICRASIDGDDPFRKFSSVTLSAVILSMKFLSLCDDSGGVNLLLFPVGLPMVGAYPSRMVRARPKVVHVMVSRKKHCLNGRGNPYQLSHP